MKLNNVSLPYPVLGNSDDITPILPADSIAVSTSFDNDTYTFAIRLNQDNPDITQLIADGYAAYTCEVTCPRTYLRLCYRSDTPEFTINLGRREVFSRIEFNCFVTVFKTIEDYSNSCQNEDYGAATFRMEPGDILAAFPTASYNADLKYDLLYSAGSFMVVLDGEEAKHTWFDANDDKIKVYLPHDMFEQFRTMSENRNFNELFHASIVFNALFKILSEYNEKTHGEYLWAESIKYRINSEQELSEFNIEDRSQAYELAQALLADPYKRLFNHLQQRQENDR